MKVLSYGASPISEDLLVKARARFNCQFVQFYGMTETTGAATYLPNEAHDPARGKLRSCGMAWPGMQLKIVDGAGREVPRGKVGEIVVKSRVVMKGYWNKPEATASSVRDGWMHTGDAAYMDDDGYVFIYDRVKDMIVTGGENVYPAEVENAIFGHPGVADVAVIGVPDEKWGEAVKAVVVAKPGAARDADSIIAWARERIAGYKVAEIRRFRRGDPAQHHGQDPAARNPQTLLGRPRPHGQLRRRPIPAQSFCKLRDLNNPSLAVRHGIDPNKGEARSAAIKAARARGCCSLIARQLMTKRVITVPAETSVRAVARVLLENNIGAVPVVDSSGALVGMASDGDLLGRRPGDQRREWWLEMLAYGSLPPDAAATVGETLVSDVMSTPLITIDPTTPAPEIAQTLRAHNIKRLPVVHNGEVVGIVTRTDLLGVIDDLRKFPGATRDAAARLLKFIGSLAGSEDLLIGQRPHSPSAAHAATAPPAPAPPLSAEQFREAVRAYKQEAVDRDAEAKREAELARKRQVDAVMQTHVSTGMWRKLIDQADVAARHGEKEFLLLRFPSDLCSDGGRMIDVAEPGWEQTLRGEAAEMYARWRSDLKPKGFGLSAKIVSYDDGILGDIGLFLTWGE